MKKRVLENTQYYIFKLRDRGKLNTPKSTAEIAGLLRTQYAKRLKTGDLSVYLIRMLRKEEIKRVMIGNKPYWYNKNVSDEIIDEFVRNRENARTQSK